MGRPSQADVLAFQLSQVSGSARASSTATMSPSSQWSSSDSYTTGTSSTEHSPITPRHYQQPSRLETRSAVARRQDCDEDDEDLEEELNDFGYGGAKKKPKESLLDLLNSDPPEWVTKQNSTPITPDLPKKKSFLARFGSRARRNDSSLDDGDSRLDNFTTLRSPKSSSSLLSASLKKKHPGKTSFEWLPAETESPRLISPPSPSTKIKTSYVAKEARAGGDSSAELVNFLRQGPPQLKPQSFHSAFDSSPSPAHSTRQRSSTTTSFDTASSGHGGPATILKAVVSKVSTQARRASLIRSDSGHSLRQILSMSPATSPDLSNSANAWRSSVLGDEEPETVRETVSPKAIELARARGATSPVPLHRMDSGLSHLSSRTSSHAKRVSRKPPPSVDGLDRLEMAYPSRPSSLAPKTPVDSESTGFSTIDESPVKSQAGDQSTSEPAIVGLGITASGGGLVEVQPSQSSPTVEHEPASFTLKPSSAPTTVINPFTRSRFPTAPAPSSPLPAAPLKSTLRPRPTSLTLLPRPSSMAYHLPTPSKSAARSSVSYSTLSRGDTIRRPSVDSPLDPPLTYALENDLLEERPVLLALMQLRAAAAEAANVPLSADVAEGASTEAGVVAAVPILRALQKQLLAASDLIDVLLGTATSERKLGLEESAVADAVLGDGEF